MIILPRYSFTLTNFISPFCTEMQRPNCPVTETARPNRPDRHGTDRNGSDQNGSDRHGQTESAKPKRPERNACLPLFVVTKRVLSNIAKL